MTDTPNISGWRDVGSALCCRQQRLPILVALILVGLLYLICFMLAVDEALLACAFAVDPALKATLGRVPAPAAVFVALTCAMVGTPMYFMNVRLMYRLVNWALRAWRRRR